MRVDYIYNVRGRKTPPKVHEGYSLHFVLVHQPPANSVLTAEVVNPPLENVRNWELSMKELSNSPFMFSLPKTRPCKHEKSLRVKTLTSLRASGLLVCLGVCQCLSTSLNANRQRGIVPVGPNEPSSNDCLAIPREASLPAKLAYIPS